jgi:WD40 repeat protein
MAGEGAMTHLPKPCLPSLLAVLLLALSACADSAQQSVLRGHDGRVLALSWSPDGGRVASAGNDGTVRIWDAATGKQIRVLLTNSDLVTGVAWSPRGDRLASVTSNAVQLWNPDNGDALRIVETGPPRRPGRPLVWGPNKVFAAWNPDGSLLFLPGWNGGDIQVLDGPSGKPHRTLKGHGGRTTALVWGPHGKRFATAGHDNTVKIWDWGLQQRSVLRGLARGEVALAWSPDGRKLAAHVLQGAEVRVWDLGGREKVLNVGSVSRVAWSPKSGLLAVGARGEVGLWDANHIRLLKVFRCGRAVDHLAWRVDGAFLAAVVFDESKLCLWRPDSEYTESLRGHGDPVIVIAWQPRGPWLASGSFDGTVRFWDPSAN